MEYDFKEGCYIDIPLDVLTDDQSGWDNYIEHAKKELSYKAFSSVAEHAMSEHGVNVKLEWHSWRHEVFGCYPSQRIGVVAYLSFPKERVLKMEQFDWGIAKQQDYHCVWCGARNPLDDKYHSGTCENCGGPKL
jgi:hypothetical protein